MNYKFLHTIERLPETINASFGPTVCMFPIFDNPFDRYQVNPRIIQACFSYQIFSPLLFVALTRKQTGFSYQFHVITDDLHYLKNL